MKHERTKSNLDEYAAMGLAALLPGMRFMLELMSRAVTEKQDLLALMQETVGGIEPAEKAAAKKSDSDRRGWPADPAARSAEMKRRMAVTKTKKGKANHPRNADHPKHAEYVAKLKASALRRKPENLPGAELSVAI